MGRHGEVESDDDRRSREGHRSHGKKSRRDDDDDEDDKASVEQQSASEEDGDDRIRRRRSREDIKKQRRSHHHHRDDDSEDEDNDNNNRKRSSKSSRGRSRHRDDSRSRRDKKKKRKKKSSSSKKSHRKRKRRYSSSSSSDDSSSSDSDDGSSSSRNSDDRRKRSKKKSSAAATTTSGTTTTAEVTNERLLAKLAARGETLEERKQRRAEKSSQKRAAYISTKFGYTPEENPFHDPNLHQAFTWNKKKEQDEEEEQQEQSSRKDPQNDKDNEPDEFGRTSGTSSNKKDKNELKTLQEIEKLRQRRLDRELQREEMDRIKREESRMKELENFDEWAKKEEHFHVQQQRQRSAIRLVDGREKPIDLLAKNVLLFGLSEQEKQSRDYASVKYQEKYNVLEELENLEAELEEPQDFLKMLKLVELQEVLVDIDAFLTLERDAQSDHNNPNSGSGSSSDNDGNTVLKYWQALRVVTLDEIQFLQTGGKEGSHAKMVQEIQKIFQDGQSDAELEQMRRDVADKLRELRSSSSKKDQDDDDDVAVKDLQYWKDVQDQLKVHLAKRELSMLHSKMLVRQLERLEQKREQLAQAAALKRDSAGEGEDDRKPAASGESEEQQQQPKVPDNVAQGFGDLEEELGLTDEIVPSNQQQQGATTTYAWADRYRPRKPRYFNRVKTGYDWNKYNKTHYDRDNPPPKTVQGYKFNIFYPDLIDPQKGTPQFKLEPADSDEFCIIRFSAGAPYEDVAFKIINREWNRARKHGFKCTFERGVLSLYFNFKNFWYRR